MIININDSIYPDLNFNDGRLSIGILYNAAILFYIHAKDH